MTAEVGKNREKKNEKELESLGAERKRESFVGKQERKRRKTRGGRRSGVVL